MKYKNPHSSILPKVDNHPTGLPLLSSEVFFMEEIWKPIKDYEGLYEISNLGRIKSLYRISVRKNGVNLTIKEKVLKGVINRLDYHTFELINSNGRKVFFLHRLFYQAFKGRLIEGMVIDHKDHDTLNNSLDNLQQISHRKNTSKDQFRHNRSSNMLGVCNRGKKWESQIYISGKNYYLGLFDSEEEASQAYQDKLKEVTNC